MAWTNILGQIRVGVRGAQSQVQTSSLLLDSYSGAAAAYSLRKLTSTYTGDAIRVRRSSDNAEQNIGFDGSGNLNTVALLAFVGSGNGFVTTWYDQSGNGRNATQTTAANQPFIVNSGSLYTLNGKAIIRNPNANVIRCLITPMISNGISRPISIIASGKVYGLPTNGYGNVAWYLGGSVNVGGGSRYEFSVSPSGFGVIRREISTVTLVSNSSNFNTTFIQQGHFGTSLLTGRFNGTDSTTSISDTNQFSANSYITLIGANAIATDFMANIGMYEYIFYFTDKTSDRVAIESNINSYYSIYASDTDAHAFITAAGITDNTQINAINTLVTDLKSAGIWSKMKALYPFVGGTPTTHKWNLKDPRDLNDAFRLTFSGGWTHSSTGALPNGTTGYAETYFNPSTNLTLYNTHISFYSRTNNTLALWKTDFAVEKEISSGNMSTITLYAGTPTWAGAWITSTDSARAYAYIGNSTGLFLGNRTSVNNIQISRNGLVGGISTVNANTISGGTQYPTDSPIIGGKKYISPTNVVSYRDFSNREVAFASLGDGLTNYESYNFYKAVEKFQTSLGRQMGSNIPTASDIDVQMFLNATQITDTTQINAISTLVSQLKSNNLWNKMRVIYPFVGGTSNTHKFNLKDPRDINEAYRLTFSGGVTHDSNGIKGSTNGYANTYFSPLTLNQNSIHFSWYSNINSLGVKADIGTLGGGRLLGYPINGAGTNWGVRINNTSNVFSSTQTTDTIGFYQVSRTSSTSIIMQKNNTQDTVSSTSATSQSNNIILLSGSGSAEFSDRQLQLVTIGEGLTTTEMNTLKTINDNYKTNLGR